MLQKATRLGMKQKFLYIFANNAISRKIDELCRYVMKYRLRKKISGINLNLLSFFAKMFAELIKVCAKST